MNVCLCLSLASRRSNVSTALNLANDWCKWLVQMIGANASKSKRNLSHAFGSKFKNSILKNINKTHFNVNTNKYTIIKIRHHNTQQQIYYIYKDIH